MPNRLLTLFLLLLTGGSAMARDFGGDGAFIPDMRELTREGYRHDFNAYPRVVYNAPLAVAKPTQAYYNKGCTVYYGYKSVPVVWSDPAALYAFGLPASFFRDRLPMHEGDVNLDHYAVAVRTAPAREQTEYIAQVRTQRRATNTRVAASTRTTRSVTSKTVATTASPAKAAPALTIAPRIGTVALPAIGEAPQ